MYVKSESSFLDEENCHPARFFEQASCRLIKLPSLFQPIEFSLSKFDSLDPTYHTSKARIRQVGKDPVSLLAYILPIENAIKARSCVRFWFILHVKNNFFKKTLKISAPNSFIQNKKKPKFFFLILDFFNKFYLLEMTIWRKKRED